MDINQYILSGIVEMYVMSLCSTEESAELELLRTQHTQVNEAVQQFEIKFEKNALQNAATTGSQLDNRILQSLHALQTPVVNIDSRQHKVKQATWLKPVAAAAMLLLAASSIFNYTLYKKNQQQQIALAQKAKVNSLPEKDYAILKTPGITPVAMYGVFPHNICRCTLFWDKKTGKAYMMIHHLVPSGTAKQYQLWAMVNDKPVNLGVVDDTIRDRFVELKHVPEGATAFTLTLENTNSSLVQVPTLEQTYLSGKII